MKSYSDYVKQYDKHCEQFGDYCKDCPFDGCGDCMAVFIYNKMRKKIKREKVKRKALENLIISTREFF